MKFCSLFSGSSGNATFIGNEHEGILIDAGKSAKLITLGLQSIGVEPSAVKAVFVTHEHSDHVSGLRVFCNKNKIPVYATGGTLEALDSVGKLDGDFPIFQISNFADIGDFHIECFHTSHDVNDPVCYTVLLPNLTKTAVMTDTGVVTEEAHDGIMGSKIILLESNHDEGMVATGPYPYSLKRRVLGPFGHLSNDAAANLAVELLERGTEHFILGHLSQENNLPELAYQTTLSRLTMEGAELSKDFMLGVAPRHDILVVEV